MKNHAHVGHQMNLQSCSINRDNRERRRSFLVALVVAVAVTLMSSAPQAARGEVIGSPLGWGNYLDFINQPASNVVPASVSNLTAIAGGFGFSLGLTTNHTVIGWGDNTLGETNIPSNVTNVVAISASDEFAMALRADGTVVAWGYVSSGETNIPPNVTNAVAIAAGYSHCLALLPNHTVVAWGNNFDNKTNVPPTLTNAVAIAAGADHCLALRADGTVIGWGDGDSGQTNVPASVTNAIAIAAGEEHSLALLANGTVVAWGLNNAGQTTVPASVTNAVAITAGVLSSMALLPNGQVVTWGLNNFSQNTVPASVTNAVAIAAGYGYDLVLLGTNIASNTIQVPTISCPNATRTSCNDTNGTAAEVTVTVADANASAVQVIWYVNGAAYQTNSVLGSGGISLTNVTLAADFAEPGLYSIFVTANDGLTSAVSCVTEVNVDSPGTVHAWGSAGFGLTNSPAGLTNAVAISKGPEQILALTSDGTVVSWGVDQFGQVSGPNGATNVVGIAAGNIFSLALKADGTVAAWGDNAYGERNVPTSVSNAVAIAAGGNHALALISNGTVIGWGDNNSGQTNVPASVTNAIAISTGFDYCLALRTDGTVVGWGYNVDGETNVPANVTNVLAISGGANHALALKADGTIVAWGSNTFGEATVPAGATNALAVSAGSFFSLALMPDGTVMAWGSGTAGQLQTEGLTDAIAISAGGTGGAAIDGLQISLVNPSATNVECHGVWTDPGATATGLCGVDLTSTITNLGTVNVNGAGIIYPVTYKVQEGSRIRFATRFVLVTDTTPPAPDVSVLPDIVAQCSTNITTAPTATDLCAGPLTGTTTNSTSFNSQGTNFIYWTYRDGSGNATIQTQRVIIAVTTPPVPNVSTLPDIIAQCSTNVVIPPTATDACTGPIITGVTSDPTTFNMQGTNFIRWTYNDNYGHSTVQTQRVIIAETLAPVVVCASNLIVNATNSAGMVVTFPTPSAANPCADVEVVCVPPSGSVFAVGTNTVTCTATDTHGHQSLCSFAVIVRGALDQTVVAFDELTALRAGITNTSRFAQTDLKNLGAALDALTNSANGTAWSNNDQPLTNGTQRVFQQDLKALKKLLADERNKHSTVNQTNIESIVNQLVAACRLSAVAAIANAQTNGVPANLITRANELVTRGDAAMTPARALSDYSAAWKAVIPKKK